MFLRSAARNERNAVAGFLGAAGSSVLAFLRGAAASAALTAAPLTGPAAAVAGDGVPFPNCSDTIPCPGVPGARPVNESASVSPRADADDAGVAAAFMANGLAPGVTAGLRAGDAADPAPAAAGAGVRVTATATAASSSSSLSTSFIAASKSSLLAAAAAISSRPRFVPGRCGVISV